MTSLLNSSLITALLCSKTSDASNFRLKAKFLTKPQGPTQLVHLMYYIFIFSVCTVLLLAGLLQILPLSKYANKSPSQLLTIT